MNRWQLKITPALQRQDILGNQYFAAAVFAAFVLHIVAYGIWYISPRPEVIDIPVRALNLKLGEVDTLTEVDVKLLEPSKTNNTKVEDILSRLVRSQEAEVARSKSVTASIDKAMDQPKKADKKPAEEKPAKPAKPPKLYNFDMRSEGVKSAAPVMKVAAKQFVRDLPPPANLPGTEEEKTGTTEKSTGNTPARDAEMVARYEQLISLWIQKFKVYPESAKQAGKTGETVARIRIDRRGNVRYYTLERSTGHLELDKAAIDMIKRANPVPAVPKNYPAGDVLEFRIPIRFNVK